MKYLFLIFTVFFSISCNKDTYSPIPSGDTSVFYDQYGRELILHGAGLYTNDDPGGYSRYNTNSARRLINDWGLNSVRMFWNWNAIEPDSAVFSREKLEAIVRVVENFTNEGVYVVLAVNGTATFSQHLVTGTWQAPAGNTINDPTLPGPVNPVVQESMRRFWNYKKYPYLQDEFINASKYLAERLKDNPYVLGYEIMNEPWGDGLVSTVLNTNLEENLLPQLYQRYISALRETEPDKYIFYEPSVLFNFKKATNFQTNLPVINDARIGNKRLAFAPHCYLEDILLHDPIQINSIQNAYTPYLTALKNRYTAIQQKQKVPIYIGEWADIDYTIFPDWENYLNKHMEAFDEIKASWAYFSYIPQAKNLVEGDDITENPPVNLITRVYPRATAGRLISYKYDPSSRIFDMKYVSRSTISAPTEIFIPKRHFPDGFNITFGGIDTREIEQNFDNNRQILSISTKAKNVQISIQITPK